MDNKILQSGLVRPQVLRAALREAGVDVPFSSRVLGTSLIAQYLRDSELYRFRPSWTFNSDFYFERYPDISREGINPVYHFVKWGFDETRNPHPLFSTKFAIQQYNALQNGKDDSHSFSAIRTALEEGLITPHPLISLSAWKEYTRESASSLEDFFYRIEGDRTWFRKHWSTYFDPDFYLTTYTEAVVGALNPLLHFAWYGEEQGRLPFAGFSSGAVRPLGLSRKVEAHRFLDLLTAGHEDLITAFSGGLKSLNDNEDSLGSVSRVVLGVVVYDSAPEDIVQLANSIVAERELAIISAVCILKNNDKDASQWIQFCEEYQFVLIDNRKNIGFGPAHNMMMDAAFKEGADCYIGANPDGFFVPGCVGELLRLSLNRDGRALVEAFSLPLEHPKVYDPVTLQTPWVSGACFLYPKRLWNEVGGFDPDMPVYCEDVDMSWRVRAAGFECIVCPSALFVHDVTDRDAAEQADGRSILREALMLEGARRLAMKWQAPEAFLDRIITRLEQNPTDLSKTIYSDASNWWPKRAHSQEEAAVCNFEHWLRFAPSRFWPE